MPKKLMPEEIDTRTPVELSRANTGQCFHALSDAEYDQLRTDLDREGGYPKGLGTRAVTLRAIPERKDAARGTSGKILLAIPTRMRKAALTALDAQEKTRAEFDGLKAIEIKLTETRT